MRCAGVEDVALSLVRILLSQSQIWVIVIITKHVFSAEIVFDSVELNAHHFQVATLDVAGDFKERQFLIIRERPALMAQSLIL